MRTRILALLLVVALLAGCGSPPPPSPSTTTTTLPTTPTPNETTTTPPTTPTPRAPVAATFYEADHDFTRGDPRTPARETFNVTSGALNLTFSVAYDSRTLPVGTTLSVNVQLYDPQGRALLACAGGSCERTVDAPEAGAWVVEYAGAGTTVAHVRASGAVPVEEV